MLNKLGIPINYNETLALIASSNNRDSESLNLEEFIHMIFSNNNAVDIDLNKIKFKDEKLYLEGEQIEKLKKKMGDNNVETSKTNDLNFVKDYLRIRIPGLVKYFNEVAAKEGLCDYDSLAVVIKKFPIPEKYKTSPILDSIYSQYTCQDSNFMDYKKFINDIIDTKESNYIFNFKDQYICKIKDKIEGNSQNLLDSINTFNIVNQKQKNLIHDMEAMKKNPEKETNNTPKEINSTVPSTEFIKKIFADKQIHFQKHKEIEKDFSPHPSLLKG